MKNPLIGKYVLVRCRDAGVHVGLLEDSEGRSCILSDARRLYYWRVKSKEGTGDFLNAIALSGPANGSKLSAPVSTIMLTENCEIIECTSLAENSLRSFPIHGE